MSATASVPPPAAALAALVSLPSCGPARLAAMLDHGGPSEVLTAVRAGDAWVAGVAGSATLAQQWLTTARMLDPVALLAGLRAEGIGVLDRASPLYPPRLTTEPSPPPVLFVQGDAVDLARRAVAIVGTRRCTGAGADLAYELGARLAAADVSVVSGLAAGIDAAAHAGALSADGAPPVGVVASGLDRPYPRRNLALWRAVASAGCMVSEAPLGTAPERWRFPARNRIIAGLAELVVVVESHASGGSLHTAAAALERDRPVVAVPGPVQSPASEGTNRLLADGAHVMCSIDDVFELLDLIATTTEQLGSDPGQCAATTAHEALVLEALGWVPTTFDDIVRRCRLPLADAAEAIEQLVASHRLVDRGGWFERTARAGRSPRAAPTRGAGVIDR